MATLKNLNILSDYTPGDLLEIVKQEGSVNKTFKVAVTNVNFCENGLVTIWGSELGATAFDPTLVGTKTRFQHIVSVKKIGFDPPSTYRGIPWSRENMKHYGVG